MASKDVTYTIETGCRYEGGGADFASTSLARVATRVSEILEDQDLIMFYLVITTWIDGNHRVRECYQKDGSIKRYLYNEEGEPADVLEETK